MSAPLREACVGEQIKDLFVLIDPVVGSIGVELGEAVSASEFDDIPDGLFRPSTSLWSPSPWQS